MRDNGFPIGVGEGLDALEAAGIFALEESRSLRLGWRALLCTNKSDWHRFDDLFDAYWLRRGMKRAARTSGVAGKNRRLNPGQPLPGGNAGVPDRVERVPGDGEIGGGEARSQGASNRENLLDTDIRHLNDPDEIARAHELAERLAARMKTRITRRRRAANRGRALDLRRVIHKSISTGGLPMRLAFRKPKPKPVRLVLILDVSGSMSQYSAFFLRFMRGVLGAFKESDAFVFHTRLSRIGDVLGEGNTKRALERLALITAGWSGGTKIGDSLETFNAHYAKRLLNGRSVVMILSDGYDTGPPDHLARQLAKIRRRARRVVWLNPMIGWRGYEPVAGGMAAALEHIDLFAPAHNLESLMALEPYLAKL
ncbi:MAG: VWA domain-containing protein [Proteobacteria bacterium]|nr:VWA domain-containing protein [Pseudomonadota bacterium]